VLDVRTDCDQRQSVEELSLVLHTAFLEELRVLVRCRTHKSLTVDPILSHPINPFHILTPYLSIALQHFVGPWLLFQFLDLLHSRQDSLDGGSARRKATTCTQDSTNTE
jgi:hypothetical protein